MRIESFPFIVSQSYIHSFIMDLLIQAVTLREDEFENLSSNSSPHPSPSNSSRAAANDFGITSGPPAVAMGFPAPDFPHGMGLMASAIAIAHPRPASRSTHRGILDGQVVSFPSNTSKHKIHIKKNTDLTFVKRKMGGNGALNSNKKSKVGVAVMAPKCGFKHFAEMFNDNEFDRNRPSFSTDPANLINSFSQRNANSRNPSVQQQHFQEQQRKVQPREPNFVATDGIDKLQDKAKVSTKGPEKLSPKGSAADKPETVAKSDVPVRSAVPTEGQKGAR